jgi:hypothetical protein
MIISTKLTRLNKVISILLFLFLCFFSLIVFISIKNDFSFFILPFIFMVYLILRVLPQKTIHYNRSEIFYYKNNKPQKIDFVDIKNIEKMSYLGLIYEIKTKQKRKLFDRLMFTPSLKESFRSFGFWKPETIKKLEKLISDKQGSH